MAEQVRQNEITFEDAGAEQDAEQNATYSIPYPVSAWYGVATDETLPPEDRDEAAKQLETLADGGDRYAQYLTGILYRDGGLLIPDTEKAQYYLELAARQDHVGRNMRWAVCSSQMIRKYKIQHRDFTGWNGRRRAAATTPLISLARNISAGRTHRKNRNAQQNMCAWLPSAAIPMRSIC